MAQYPIDRDDRDNIADAVNNLLSGPSGLGQNFAGFSAYTPVYLTGSYRVPFTVENFQSLFIAPISLGACEMLDGRTWKYYFASVQPSIPFNLGTPITITGVTNSYYDNSFFSPIGVVSCTTEYVICRTSDTYPIVAPSSGGTAQYDTMDYRMSTDANARVTVTSATDRVFISGQVDQTIDYTTLGLDDLIVSVQLNRYSGFLNQDPTNPDYLFGSRETITLKEYTYTNLNGSGTLPLIETVFATVIDSPGPGFYWYILEVQFTTTNTLCHVTSDRLGLRDLSAQVVKQ